jgi:hypothetical protein
MDNTQEKGAHITVCPICDCIKGDADMSLRNGEWACIDCHVDADNITHDEAREYFDSLGMTLREVWA